MKLFQIEYFLAVCKYESISKAADAILVSRPAVSRAIKDIEDEFGISLFQRTTSGVKLTEAGQLVYDKCSQIQQLLNDLRNDIGVICGEIKDKKERTLSVGLSYTARCCVLPFMTAFKNQYPDVHLHLTDMKYSYLDTNFLDPDYDIIITLRNKDVEGVDFLDIGESYFAFCCHQSHPLAKQKIVTVEQIKDEPLIALTGLDSQNNQHIQIYEKHGLKPNIAYKTVQVSSVRQMIKENLCCSIQPVQSMENDVDIVTIPIDGINTIKLRLIWNNQRRYNTAFRDFIDYASRYFLKRKLRT